jgi:TRAP-type C4-dicarboxylate transport system substrate-binding protein
MSGSRSSAIVAACLAAVCVVFAGPVRPSMAEEIKWKAITPWPMSYYWCEPMKMFEDMVHERLAGKLAIDYLGGGEVAPPFEQLEALRNGVVDVILGASSYYTGQVPEALGVLYAKLPPSELRKTGYYDLMRQIHMEKAGVVYLANVGGSPGKAFRFFTKVKVDKPDFTNLKIRVTPVYTELVEALGGTPITMKPSEVYTAMERGVVDGYGWSYGGITDFAWQEVTKYVIDHPFYSANTAILINKDAWDKLPDDVKATLEEIGIELEKKAETYMEKYNAEEDARLADLGLEFVKFSDADAARFIKTAYDVAWTAFIKAHPDVGPKLRELSE